MQHVMTEEEVRSNIAANVARLRLALKLSKYELGKAVGISTIQVTRIERGDHVPGPAILARLAEILRTTVDGLIGFTTSPKKIARAS